MSASGPKAEDEYSRGRGPAEGVSGDPRAVWERRFERHRNLVLVAAMLGALLLVVAEFTPLLHVHTVGHAGAVRTVSTGAHDSYALIPVAVAAAALALNAWRSGSRLALLGIGVLGLVTLGIALIGDLPQAHSTGLIGNTTTGLRPARSDPAIGLFLETAGGLVLLLSAAAGMLLEPIPGETRRPRRRPKASDARSAS
jgi:hypothetical protein